MGKAATFTIRLLDNETNEYRPGEKVSGIVNLILDKPLEIRGVRLHIDGKAHCYWSETDSDNNTKSYSQDEKYIDQLTTFWGKQKGEDGPNPIMKPGFYEFPFSFDLPLNSPPNYKGYYGWIGYSCKAYIDIPFARDDQCSVELSVLDTVDLNTIQNALTPQQQQKSSTMCCWCCVGGTIEGVANIQRTGFVPGESIAINGEIDNKSVSTVSRVSIELLEKVTFKAVGDTKISFKTITSTVKQGIASGDSLILSNEYLIIPETRNSIMSCSILQLNYELQIKVVPEGCHKNFLLTFPIIVGNVPLKIAGQKF